MIEELTSHKTYMSHIYLTFQTAPYFPALTMICAYVFLLPLWLVKCLKRKSLAKIRVKGTNHRQFN
uniref:Uncharacterized protein n=1 Tax=Octopus bimaculoides TaxID=37653 RepID=A0A0L8GYC3_OCTBM